VLSVLLAGKGNKINGYKNRTKSCPTSVRAPFKVLWLLYKIFCYYDFGMLVAAGEAGKKKKKGTSLQNT
jgi:hypothetical protein